MKRIVSILFLLILLCSNVNAENILIISHTKYKSFDYIYNSFKNEIAKHGHSVKIFFPSKDNSITEKIFESKSKYVFCIGTNAAKVGKDTGLMGVFTMVINPIESGLVDEKLVSKGNLTGIHVNTNPIEQFKVLKMLGLKRRNMGVIYDPINSSRLVGLYNDNSIKFSFISHPFQVLSSEDVPKTFERFKKSVNFIVSIVDRTVFTRKNFFLILKFSYFNKIPFIGFTSQHTQSGALMSFYQDYEVLGKDSAKLMNDLMKDKSVLKKQMAFSSSLNYDLNLETFNIMKLKPSKKLKDKAFKIYKK